MGKHDDELRELLVELAYDELPEGRAAAAPTALDEDALRTLAAFRAVRRELRDSDEVPAAAGRIAFVALRPPATGLAAWSPWAKGLAVAASFLAGLLLTAAIANLEVRRDAAGWSLRAGLWHRPVQTGAAASATPGGGGVVAEELRPAAAGALPAWSTATAGGGALTGTDPASLRSLFEQLLEEREPHLRALVQQAVAASEQRQRQQVSQALADLYRTFDAQRTNDLLFLAGELGLLQENTGLELQRANAAIDYLLTRVAAAPPAGERRDE